MAEVWGLFEGLSMARNLGIERLEVQVDAEALFNKKLLPSCCKSYMMMLWVFLPRLISVKFLFLDLDPFVFFFKKPTTSYFINKKPTISYLGKFNKNLNLFFTHFHIQPCI
jgi:hypothetical protein